MVAPGRIVPCFCFRSGWWMCICICRIWKQTAVAVTSADKKDKFHLLTMCMDGVYMESLPNCLSPPYWKRIYS